MIYNDELKRQSDKILALIKSAEDSFEYDDEMRSHFAKYICILCAGFLENVVHVIYIEYIKKETTSLSVISLTSMFLNKIRNPNSDKFKEIAKGFCAEWESELNKFMIEDERNSAINYIMRDRHKIAHGKDSDITLSRIKEYHMKAVEITVFIERQCGLTTTV